MKLLLSLAFLTGLLEFTIKTQSIKNEPFPGYKYASMIWFKQPATNWNEALPLGNGRLGAMVFGGITDERLQLNEETLWSGGPRNWNNPEAKKYLPLVREVVHNKNYRKADSLSKFMQGPYTESYLPMADVLIHYNGIKDSSKYTRNLNLDEAVHTVEFTNNGTTCTRTSFASYPDQVIVYNDTCSAKEMVSFSVTLNSKLHYTVQTVSPNHLVLKGKCPKHVEPVYLWKIKDAQAIQYDSTGKEGMNFEVHLLVKTFSGKISCTDNIIKVDGANAATLLLSAATSYNGFDKSPGLRGKDPSVKAKEDVQKAAAKTYDRLLRNHLADYQPIFRRVNLFLGKSQNQHLPTDERMKQMENYTDPEMVALVSQYGRYLLIAGSRKGGQPVNLKGIWNDKVRPEYSSNWCIDHDAQMFYYPVETNNLSEMHEPFLQFIEDLSKNGQQTAAINYGMKGWCAHHNTDIWRQTGPVGNYGGGNPHWATWNMSGPWLSAHLYDHYLFTGDKYFLQQKAWPVMQGAAEFCLDWLIADSSGHLISVPSVSPENTFITANGDTAEISSNTTADIALIKELFTQCISTASILNIDKAFASKLKIALAKLAPYKIGSMGQLLEWEEEWRPVDPSHRHLSHMYPVFPGNEISPLHTPELANAAKKALTLREKTNCSWGFAWKAACWARLGEGDSAWNTLQNQLRYVDGTSKSPVTNYGLFPNLFNSEAPSVIMNGNGCVTAVITEMLVQSQSGEIQLLPALPHQFPAGFVKGICARGGFEIELKWENSLIKTAGIFSKLGNKCRLKTNQPVKIFSGKKEILVTKTNDNILSFNTKKGSRYDIVVQ